MHDSIHVSENTKGDTVWLEVSRWHTIQIPYPVEVIKEVEKELNWRERIQMGVGKFAMWLLLAGAAMLIFKIAR